MPWSSCLFPCHIFVFPGFSKLYSIEQKVHKCLLNSSWISHPSSRQPAIIYLHNSLENSIPISYTKFKIGVFSEILTYEIKE